MVTKKESKTSASGRPWMSYEIEDKTGVYAGKLFSRDYEKFQSVITEGSFLYMEGMIEQPRRPTPEESYDDVKHEFRLKEVALLGNLCDTKVKEFVLELDAAKVSSEEMARVYKVLRKHKGNTSVILQLVDFVRKYQVQLRARKISVAVSTQLVQELQDMGVKATLKV